MLARMGDTTMINRFSWMMTSGSVYEISGLGVVTGGEGIHSSFHLLFRPHTVVVDSSDLFTPFKYHLFFK